jgi:cytochrome d ubiquinol oxidase subunit II
MTLAILMAGVMWLGVTLYALFAGADFGGGFWDLVAGGAKRGQPTRELIEHSIGPVWEANHVWLIFVLVVMWTCFPRLFGAVASTLWMPFTLAAFGIICRGSAFAFRKSVHLLWQRRLLGAAFAISSVITPFFLGTIAGAVASGQVPPGIGRGDALHSWTTPLSLVTGVLAVAVCGYLAAVYLTGDARRTGDTVLLAGVRRRALGMGVAAGPVAIGTLLALHFEAPQLLASLLSRALPIVALSIAGGLASLALLWWGSFLAARAAGGVAVAAVLWGWAVAQYPHLLQTGLTIQQAAAEPSVLAATAISLAVGALLFIPSLIWLYILFQRGGTDS